jgi:hypothetical protein
MTVVEPSERFAHRRNVPLLALLKNAAVKGRGEPFDLEGYQLHTHPDLCDHLQSLNPHCYAAAYGIPVLANDGGVLFAMARGTSHLAFLLSDSDWEKAREAGGFDSPDLGEGWFGFEAWRTDKEVLLKWCRAAHAFANKIGKGKTP